MAREPSYPEDAPVGGREEAEARGAIPGDERTGGEEGANAIEAAKAAQQVKAGAGRTRGLVTGAAIGIGSAALVAALLYARNTRGKGGRNGPERH